MSDQSNKNQNSAPKTTSEGTPSDDSSRDLWCLIEGDALVRVTVAANKPIAVLKELVYAKGKTSVFGGIDAKDLVLLKVDIPFPGLSTTDLRKLQITGNAVLIDQGWGHVSDFWPVQPADMVHIFVRSPASTITTSQSIESNLAPYLALKRPHPDSPDDLDGTKRMRVDNDAWLLELHSKIWDRKDLWQELFHTVEITAAHYYELQERLGKLYPDRHTRDYHAGSEGVLSTKLELLRNFKPPLVAPARELAAHTDNERAENNEEEENNDDDKGNNDDDEGNNDDDDPCSLFPVTLKYLDLSYLELENTTLRMPLAFLIRNEYEILSELVDRQGSAIISGQPGTGKTTYFYLRMVVAMINGSPFLYQTLGGTVYHVSDTITTITSWPSGSGSGKIVAYVDADEKKFEPQSFIRHRSVKIIAASSPKGTDQPWMKQMGNVGFPITFASAMWTDSELFVTGIFLHPQDLTYTRLKQATTYFGFSPRLCFNASDSVFQLRQLQSQVEAAVEKAALERDIGSLIVSFKNSSMLSHTIFELSPRDGDRLFGDVLVGTVSPWALDLLLGAYEFQKADAAAEFYDSIADMPKAGILRGQIFERQVLRYLDSKSRILFQSAHRGTTPSSNGCLA